MIQMIRSKVFGYAAMSGVTLLLANALASAVEPQSPDGTTGQSSRVQVSSGTLYQMTPAQAANAFSQLRSALSAPNNINSSGGSGSADSNAGSSSGVSPGGGLHCPAGWIVAGNRCMPNPGGPVPIPPPTAGGGSGSSSGGSFGGSLPCPAGWIVAGNRCMPNPGGPVPIPPPTAGGGSGSSSGGSSGGGLPCPGGWSVVGNNCVPGPGAGANSPCPPGEIAVSRPIEPLGLGLMGAASTVAQKLFSHVQCIPAPTPPMVCPGGGTPIPDPAMAATLASQWSVSEHWVCPPIGIGSWCPHIVGPIYPTNHTSWFIRRQAQLVMGSCLPGAFGGPIGGAMDNAVASSPMSSPLPHTQPSSFPQPFEWCSQRGLNGSYWGSQQLVPCRPGEHGAYFPAFPVFPLPPSGSSQASGITGIFGGLFSSASSDLSAARNDIVQGGTSARSAIVNFFSGL